VDVRKNLARDWEAVLFDRPSKSRRIVVADQPRDLVFRVEQILAAQTEFGPRIRSVSVEVVMEGGKRDVDVREVGDTSEGG
jgi:hypothetical protein